MKALAQKNYASYLGNKFPRMNEEQVKELMKEAKENPLNAHTAVV